MKYGKTIVTRFSRPEKLDQKKQKKKEIQISALTPCRKRGYQAIKKTKNRKASSPDGIFIKHLKDKPPQLKEIWTEIYT
jgi:hypothetical protein